MTVYKKIGCIGDSYAATMWGLSWPDLLAEKLNCEFVRVSSMGAGNAYYIEKCHDVVKDSNVDLIIVQLTDSNRIYIGTKGWEINPDYNQHRLCPPPLNYLDLNHSHCYKDMGCYTMNIHNNERHLEPMANTNVAGLDRFWLNQCVDAKFYHYQTLHHMLAIKALCDSHNKKLIFWTWFVGWDDIFLPGYEWFKNQLLLVPGYGKHEGESRNLPLTDWHYATTEFRILFDVWLWPNIKPLL